MSHFLAPEQLDALSKLSTCAASNAIETFGTRLRNEGFTRFGVVPFFPRLSPALGYAVTLKIRCSSPPPVGGSYLERTEWWNQILSIPSPRIVAIEDVDPQPGTGALVGEIHANILKALGCVGVLTNGAVRDLPAIEGLKMHVFASRVAVSHAYVHIVETGTPVRIGGLDVHPSDLLLGDGHGVLSIPHQHAAEIPRVAAEMIEKEKQLVALCQKPQVAIDELRSAVQGLRANAA